MDPIIEIRDLAFDYGRPSRLRPSFPVRALRGIDLVIEPGSSFGLVGESGSGKSTLIRVLNGLLRGYDGSVRVRGADISRLDSRALRAHQASVQMVFQDTYSALNPRDTVEELVSEGWDIHPHLLEGADRRAATYELMEKVGLGPSVLSAYPHQLSGGQRQRVAIARALALRPSILLCDEPTSALDVSIQAQILKLLHDLRRNEGITLVVVSHDLGVIRSISDEVGILYLGRLVEYGPCEVVFERPQHPYTKALLSSASALETQARDEIILEGEIPSPTSPPSGCAFRTRCWKAAPRCADVMPQLMDHDLRGTSAACHYPLLDQR